MEKRKDEVSIRSSAAEYLTYIASVGDDETVFEDAELEKNSVIRKFRITATDEKPYDVMHYNLQMIIAVGFRVDSERAVQFRKWVNQIAKDYAIHGHTAAELIVERADSEKEHMGLTTWKDAPDGKIIKSDVIVAKNYLSEHEMAQLNRMVSSYLDFAESMAVRKIPLTMQDWEKRLNSFIEMFQYGLLRDAGKVTAEIAKLHAETEFEKYRIVQDKLFMSDYDRFLIELEGHIEG